MDALTLDLKRSKLTLRTYAKGLLSAVAHDLELSAPFTRGRATKNGDQWDGEIALATSAIKVVGVLKGGKVVRDVLSAWEVREIERRIADDVFGGAREVVVSAKGTPDSPEVRVILQREQVLRPKISLRVDGNASIVSVRGAVSMKTLGIAEVRGPLGAFSIKDEVEVEAEAYFTAT